MTEVTDPILDIQKEWLDGLVLPACPIVVDVGANIGRFTEEVIHRWPDARVICFEPQPTAAALITGLAEVRNIALGDKRETLKLFCNPGGTDMSASLHQESVGIGDWTDGIDVPVERLDEQRLTRIDLLKIDAEGNELEVMLGAGCLLHPNYTRVIQWEVNRRTLGEDPAPRIREFCDLLEPRGYIIGWIDRGGFVRPPSSRQAPDHLGNFHWEFVAA